MLARLSGGELELVQADRRDTMSKLIELAGSPISPPPPPPPPPPRRRQKRAAERILNRHQRKCWENDAQRRNAAVERERIYREKYLATVKNLRGTLDDMPPMFPLAVRLEAAAQMRDTSGRAIELALETLPPVHAEQIRFAALGVTPAGCVRDWAVERARAIGTFGIAQCRMARPSGRKGRWAKRTRGFTRGAWASLLQGSRTRPVHRNTVSGVHRAGQHAAESANLGYVQALEASGLLMSQQLPPERCQPWELWVRRWVDKQGVEHVRTFAANWYWVSNPNPYDRNLLEDTRQAMLELLHAAESAQEFRLRPRSRPASEAPPPPAEPAPPDD